VGLRAVVDTGARETMNIRQYLKKQVDTEYRNKLDAVEGI
jgi:hypothetical protein